MTAELRLVSVLFILSASFTSGATVVRHAEEAVGLAEKDGIDIAVLVRGSDFCGAGESIMDGVWSSAEFSKSLGDSYVVFNADHREWWQWNSVMRLLLDRKSHSGIELLEIDSVKSKEGAELKVLPDGSFLASGKEHNTDIYVVNLAAAKSLYSSIVIDALTDKSLPGKGPGRGNGNFVLSEVTGFYEVDGVERTIKFDGVWGDPFQNNLPASHAIDGDMSNNNGWAPNGGKLHKDSRLVLTMVDPVPAGVSLVLKLSFISKYGKHIAGRLKFSAFRDDKMEAAVRERYEATVLWAKNKALAIKTGNYPAVLVFNSKKQLLGALHAVPYDISIADMVENIKKFSAKDQRMNHILEESKTAVGIEKATLLGEWLDLKGCTSSKFGHKNVHKPVFEELKKADPEDKTDYVRKYDFNGGAIGKEATRLSKDVNKQAAIDYLNRQIADPHNSRLAAHQIQVLYLYKWRIYRGWKDQGDNAWATLKKMAEADRDTFLGMGSEGKILIAKRGGPVTMRHGWRPYNIKRGHRTMVMNSGVDLHFIDAGPYEVMLTSTADGSPLAIHSVALFVEGEEVSRDDHTGQLINKNENIDNAYMLSLPETCYDKEMELRIEYEAINGTDCNGRIAVRHVLPWEKHLLASTAPKIMVKEEQFLESTLVEIKAPRDCRLVYYTTDGSSPGGDSYVYKKPFMVNKTMTIRAVALFRGEKKYFGRKSEIKLKKIASSEPDENGVFLLQSLVAHIEGSTLKYAKNYNCLGYWSSKSAFAWWAVHFSTPGKYKIVMVQAVDKPSAGNKYELSIGDQKLAGTTRVTRNWSDFVELEVGVITIKQPCYEKLTVRPVSIKPGNALMNLRSVKIIPVD